MQLPETIISQEVIIEREIEGGYDDNGDWQEGGPKIIAIIQDANILPKSGSQIASVLQTSYESDYEMYAGSENITFEEGYGEIKKGDTVIDSKEKKYNVVFPGNYGPAYVSQLKGL